MSGPAALQDLPYYQLPRMGDLRHLRSLALAALLAAVLPAGRGVEGALYLWELLPVVDLAEAVRLLSPALLGVGLLVTTIIPRQTRLGLNTLSLVLLVVCITIFSRSDLAYAELFSGPLDYVGRQPLPIVVGLSLVALGADLRTRSSCLSWSRVALWIGIGLLVFLYFLPQRGRPFGVEIVDSMARVLGSGSGRLAVGLAFYWLFDLFPLAMAVAGTIVVWRSGGTWVVAGIARYGLAGMMVLVCFRMLFAGFDVHGLLLNIRAGLLLAVVVGVASRSLEGIVLHLLDDPLPPPPGRSDLARDVRLRTLLGLWIRRWEGAREAPDGDLFHPEDGPRSHPLLTWLMRRRFLEFSDDARLPTVGPDRPNKDEAQILLARMEGTAPWKAGQDPADMAAVREADRSGETVASGPGAVAEPGHPSLWLMSGPIRLYWAALVATGLLVVALGWYVSRPQPDLRWTLRPTTSGDRELFADRLPEYVLALAQRNRAVKQDGSGAEAAVRLRGQKHELLELARDVDRGLVDAFEELFETTDTLDLGGLIWLDAIASVNRRIRALGLPYYLDAHAVTWVYRNRSAKLFYVVTYEVKRIHRFEHDGREYAALHVSRADRLNVEGNSLGFVREDEPFALVVLDTVDDYVTEFLEAVDGDGRCGIAPDGAYGTDLAVDRACGRSLHALLTGRGFDGDEGAAERFETLARLQLEATERHEIQHQVDGKDLDIPGELYRLLPIVSDEKLLRAARETSAYLSELVTDEPLVTVTVLGQLTGFVLSSASRRSPYRYAAGLVLGGLAGEPVLEPFGDVRDEPLVGLWSQLVEQGQNVAPWVTERVREIHEDLFGEPCAEPKPAD